MNYWNDERLKFIDRALRIAIVFTAVCFVVMIVAVWKLSAKLPPPGSVPAPCVCRDGGP